MNFKANFGREISSLSRLKGVRIMVDYRYLKVFMLTAKHASFSKAAQELGIAQSAISRQIKLLEQSLGKSSSSAPRKRLSSLPMDAN